MNLVEEEEEKKMQRAILRERFLRMLKSMENKELTIETYQGACVQGKFRSIDYDIANVHVSDLQTPIGIMPEALIRYTDILSIKFTL
jgi:gem associated protein 7